MDFESMFPEYRSRGKEAGLGALAEVLEVVGSAVTIGALEQRYGEQKMTIMMSPKLDAAGNPVPKDANGNQPVISGTGIPVSAVASVIGLGVAVFAPGLTMRTRKHLLNIGTGLGSAFGYRKGIEWGQKWLDSKQPAGTSKLPTPAPPYEQSASAIAEIASVKGEDINNVADLDREAARILAQRQRQAA